MAFETTNLQATGEAGVLDKIKLALFGGDRGWTIYNTDSGEVIHGQFTAQNANEDIGGEWARLKPFGRPHPVLHYTGGSGEKFTFQARFWSRHALQDVTEAIEKVKALARSDPDLKRPPICFFTWGTDLGVQCVVESVGGVQYDEIQGTGRLRGAVMPITLLRYEPFAQEEIDPAALQHLSLRRPLSAGDTHEMVALRTYGDPMKGVWLRQLHASDPNRLNEQSGVVVRDPVDATMPDDERAVIHVPADDVAAAIVPTPESFLFLQLSDPSSEQSALLAEALELRRQTAVIIV